MSKNDLRFKVSFRRPLVIIFAILGLLLIPIIRLYSSHELFSPDFYSNKIAQIIPGKRLTFEDSEITINYPDSWEAKKENNGDITISDPKSMKTFYSKYYPNGWTHPARQVTILALRADLGSSSFEKAFNWYDNSSGNHGKYQFKVGTVEFGILQEIEGYFEIFFSNGKRFISGRATNLKVDKNEKILLDESEEGRIVKSIKFK